MSTSKPFMNRDLHKFFKNDLKQLREVKPLGKALFICCSTVLQNGQNIKLQRAGLTGRNSKITTSSLVTARTWMTAKSYVIRNVYSNVAENSFVKENETLDFSIVSKRQHIQGEQSSPI